jgi:Pyruvate/2-oxoacid:ferredoxin oxidoreductase delta subunit
MSIYTKTNEGLRTLRDTWTAKDTPYWLHGGWCLSVGYWNMAVIALVSKSTSRCQQCTLFCNTGLIALLPGGSVCNFSYFCYLACLSVMGTLSVSVRVQESCIYAGPACDHVD